MNQQQTEEALAELAASPAAAWVGNRMVKGGILRCCTRCGTESFKELPKNIRGPADVPAGFDEELFAWMRDFQRAHESCLP